MPMGDWSAEAVGDQNGRTALITGANSGIGLETARVLAGAGAHVILACRNMAKAELAQADITTTHPGARTSLLELDLGDLPSVERAASSVLADYAGLDLCIANAGVMAPPLQRTAQGFELQMGTNHLGHFALVGRILPALIATDGSRVVTVSSQGHRMGRINLEDLNFEHRRYNRFLAYGASKLANLHFTAELQRRLSRSGAPTIATAAHPGGSNTELDRHLKGPIPALRPMLKQAIGAMTQSAEMGALPTLRAATDPSASGDAYYGPNGPGEQQGPPVPVGRSTAARDETTALGLWELSSVLTGVLYERLD